MQFCGFRFLGFSNLVSFLGLIRFDLCVCLCSLVGLMVSDFCLTFIRLTFSSVWLLTLEDRSGD